MVFLLILVALKSLQAQQLNTTIHKPISIYPDTQIVINAIPISK